MTFRVLTGLFGHESNAFSKLPTTLDNFENYLLAFGDDVPAKSKGHRSNRQVSNRPQKNMTGNWRDPSWPGQRRQALWRAMPGTVAALQF